MNVLSESTVKMGLQALRKEIRRLDDMLSSETLYDVNKFQQQHDAYRAAERELNAHANECGYE